MSEKRRGVVVDVDGTMLDTNYLHVVAWIRALRARGYDDITMAQVHHAIGMASAKLIEHLTGGEDEELGEEHSRQYEAFQDDVRALPGAADLLTKCAEADVALVIATSGRESDLDWMLPAIGVDRSMITGTATSGDVEKAKPAPDLMEAAMKEGDLDPAWTVALGDTVWDIEAAARAGIGCIAFRCGGIGGDELRDAGAIEVWDDPADLLAHLSESRLGELTKP
ncbi:HAD family hydrolase [Mobilicoccus massiliensis]|uniref:HAD family hydrolase n=1 Tax=Mobilicoccus massiliensis TaxID=1522310 RepID=UPI00058C7000|nr:HAD family hydrolase [Mobilicoccus massiliensis]